MKENKENQHGYLDGYHININGMKLKMPHTPPPLEIAVDSRGKNSKNRSSISIASEDETPKLKSKNHSGHDNSTDRKLK